MEEADIGSCYLSENASWFQYTNADSSCSVLPTCRMISTTCHDQEIEESITDGIGHGDFIKTYSAAFEMQAAPVACTSTTTTSTISTTTPYNNRQTPKIGTGKSFTSFAVGAAAAEEERKRGIMGISASSYSSNSSKSHSQAEKRRRDRINAQLATLRKLIPRSDKMDKAALLGSTVDRIKQLKIETNQINKTLLVPSEIDEVKIEEIFSEPSNLFIKATFCCEDRPELFKDLETALKGLKLTVVKTDISCLGSRVKTILILCAEDGAQGEGRFSLANVKQPLRATLNRLASFSNSTPSSYRLTSRRQRLLFPSLS